MAQIDLNIRFNKDGTLKEFVPYLETLAQNHSSINICQSLLEAVAHDDLQASIFTIFLPWSKSPPAIASCIRQGPSRRVRRIGIKHFGKAMGDAEQWESTWTGIGGIQGLLDVFAEASIKEVKALVGAIGSCNYGIGRVRAREKVVEELLHALLPSHYPTLEFKSSDKRSIGHSYANMVPACSPEFVDELLDARDLSNPLYEGLPSLRLLRTHRDLLQERLVNGIFFDGIVDLHFGQYLQAFLSGRFLPPSPKSADSADSTSMIFATKLLHLRILHIDHQSSWPSEVSEATILLSLIKRSLQRGAPELKLHSLFALGLQLLEVFPNQLLEILPDKKLMHDFRDLFFWRELVSRWRGAPELYEDVVGLALRLGLGGDEATIGQDCLKNFESLHMNPEQSWGLIRLYCLHVPKRGLDLDSDEDLRPLARMSWPYEIFYRLRKEQAVRLLKGLLMANSTYSFLQGRAGCSILSSILNTQDIPSQENFNVGLLLTILQRQDKEMQLGARRAVDELRKKAVRAREPSDRGQFARAASHYAIASGNLDLFLETVMWLRRYIRDRLALHQIFAFDTVMTEEGIDLLSGIPEPLPNDLTLEGVASKVEKANQILLVFDDILHTAEQEPSFCKADWKNVASLFGAVISRRVTRAKHLQKYWRRRPATDMYTTIWSGIFVMLQEVRIDSLDQAFGPIEGLLGTLPPTALAAAIKTMLGAINENLKNRPRVYEWIELLSYEGLLLLAKGDRPELAQPYILQTILQRLAESSLHKVLMSSSFISSLNAKEARGFLLAFANSISEKLEDQSYVIIDDDNPSQSTQPSSIIKVTTVKYLAELLNNTEYLPFKDATGVLLKLLKTGTHIDVRLATLESLLSMLNSICSRKEENSSLKTSEEELMQALETIIPIAGSINEIRPLQQEDWEEAIKRGTLPDISNTNGKLPPLLEALVTGACSTQLCSLKKLHGELMPRLFLPILRRSKAEHRMWVALFLKNQKANLVSVDDLPPTPITWKLWYSLIKHYTKFVPSDVLEDFHNYTLMTIAPPANLKSFNDLLRQNYDSSNTLEVQHWLSIFDQRLSTFEYHKSGTNLLVGMITSAVPHSEISNGIGFGRVLEMVIEQISLILAEYEFYRDLWEILVDDLAPPTETIYLSKNAETSGLQDSRWQRTTRILLDRIIVVVSDMRQKLLAEGKHCVLPSTMKLRLWLLPYPCSNTAEIGKQCQGFVRELDKLLSDFLDGDNNILLWNKIANHASTACKLLTTDEQRLSVALHMSELIGCSAGVQDRTSSALNLVRITLVMKLIEDGRHGLVEGTKPTMPENLVKDLKKIFQAWQNGGDKLLLGMLTDWRQEQKDLWTILTRK